MLQYVLSKWTLAFLVGLLTGIIASLINLAVENITGYKLLAVVRFIEQNRSEFRDESSFLCVFNSASEN